MMQVSEAALIFFFIIEKNYIRLSAEGLQNTNVKTKGYVGFCRISCGRDARGRRHLRCKYTE